MSSVRFPSSIIETEPLDSPSGLFTLFVVVVLGTCTQQNNTSVCRNDGFTCNLAALSYSAELTPDLPMYIHPAEPVYQPQRPSRIEELYRIDSAAITYGSTLYFIISE